MVFAKTSKSASRLSESIRTKDFNKTYLAVVYDNDNLLDKEGTFEDYMIKNEALNKSTTCSKDKRGAKFAKLSYKVLDSFYENEKALKLVMINLETGRHHQIRVQFAVRGFPLYGDQKYGIGPKEKQIALWAYKLSFKHPTKDEIMEFECLPDKVGVWENFSSFN